MIEAGVGKPEYCVACRTILPFLQMPRLGAIYDQIMIKRLEWIRGTQTVKIISDNKRYDPIEMAAGKIKINGKVIWFGRELERE